MPKCPVCKEEIKELYFDVTATCAGYIKKGESCSSVVDIDALHDRIEFDNFICPKCETILFENSWDAEDFLK